MADSSRLRLGTRDLAILFLFALVIRLSAIAAVGFSKIGFGDGLAYLDAAKQLVLTGHYPLRTDDLYFRAPGYPVFLVLATLGHPGNVALAKIANALCGALSVVILAALSARIFRRRKTALATGALAAVHPSFILQSSDIQSEALFLLLLLTAGYLLIAAGDRPSSNLAVLSGLLLGLAALTRPTALLLAPLSCAGLFDRRYPIRARCHIAASALLGLFLALAPWTLRNALVFHRFIPVSDSFGAAFYDGNSVWMERFYDVRSRKDYAAWTAAMVRDRENRLSAIASRRAGPGQSPSRILFRLALDDLRADPRASLRLYLLKTAQWLRPFPTPWFWPMSAVVLSGIYYTLLYFGSAWGLYRADRRGVALSCVAVLLVTTLHVFVVPTWRYRVPFWDPVLLLYGVFAAGLIAAARRRDGGAVTVRRRQAAARPLG